MPRALVCIAGHDTNDQLHDATLFLAGVVAQEHDRLNILRDCGRGLGPFMLLGILIETGSDKGIRAVQGAMEALTGRPGTPCFGCRAFCIIAGSEPTRADPLMELRLDVMTRDEPGVLKELAGFFARKSLSIHGHHGRHAGDNMYLAEFTLVPRERRFEDYCDFVRELKDLGFEVRRLDVVLRPDRIAGGDGEDLGLAFPGG